MSHPPLFSNSRINILLIIDITVVTYLTLFVTGFSSLDDTGLLETLQHGRYTLASLAPAGSAIYLRPLTILTYLIDYKIWGANPVAFHLTNLVIHVANASLVYYLCCRYLEQAEERKSAALFAALVFAVAPLNSESVIWVSDRTDLLCCFFFLATFTVLFCEKLSPFFSACALSLTFFCSLLAKESSISMMAIVPAYLFVLDRNKRTRAGRIYLCSATILVVAAYFYLRIGPNGNMDTGVTKVVSSVASNNFLSIVYKNIAAFGFYAKKLLWPYPLNLAIHDINVPIYFVSGILVLVAIIIFWARFKTARLPLLIVIASLIPPLLAFQGSIPWTLYAERYLYIPMTGMALLISLTVASCTWLPRALPFVLIIPLALSTIHRVGQWADPVNLWHDTTAKSPGFPQARVTYAYELIQAGRISEAKKQIHIIRSMNYENELLLRCIATIKKESPRKDDSLDD